MSSFQTTCSIESGCNWQHSHNLSSVIADFLSRTLASKIYHRRMKFPIFIIFRVFQNYKYDWFCTNVKSHYIERNHCGKTENMQCLLKNESIAFIRNFFCFISFPFLSFLTSFLVSREKIYTKVLTYFCQYVHGKRNKGFQDSNSYFLTNTMQYWEPFSRISFRK